MPVTVQIPLTEDYRETAAVYPDLTELLLHPTNGYLYGCYNQGGVGKIVKIHKDNYADATVANLPVAAPIDMHYSATNDKFYVVYRTTNSPVTEVHPTTLAMASFFSITSVGGQGAITGDTANLYVATFSTQKLYSISLATGLQVGVRTMPVTGYAKINCLRSFGSKLYALSMDIDYVQLSRIAPANLGTEEVSSPIGIAAGEVPVDDLGESTSHVFVGNRDLLGIIRKYSKTDFSNPELIETTQLSKCTCVKTVGAYVWSAFENGRGVRINTANTTDRSSYTLNDGQGYHSEFTGDNAFVHTYNLNTTKIARYRIPLPNDFTPPVVNLTFPINGSVLTGTVLFTATATDNFGVQRVEFYINNYGQYVLIGTVTSSPYQLSFDSRSVTNGQHTVFARAFDFAGNNSFSTASCTAQNALPFSGTFKWLKRIQAISTETTASVSHLRFDSAGSVIAVGRFTNEVSFDGGPTKTSAGNNDVFIVKYLANGTFSWLKTLGNVPSDFANGVAVDSGDNVIITGSFAGDVDFGNGIKTPVGTADAFIVKYGPTGTFGWFKQFGAASVSCSGRMVVTDSGDNVLFTGVFPATVNFGGTDLTSAGSTDIVLAKYAAADGAHLWSKRLGGTGAEIVNGITVLSGDPIIVGSFDGTVNFGGGDRTGPMLIAKFLGLDGSHVWSMGFTGGTVSACHVNPDNELLVCGGLTTPIDFGGGARGIAGSTAFYIAKYNSAGVHLFSKALATSGVSASGQGTAIFGGNEDNIAIGGTVTGTVDFGDGQQVSGIGMGFINKYSPIGLFLWSKQCNATSIGGIATNSTEEVAAGGSYSSTVDFGGGVVSPNAAGNVDGYIVKYGP